MISSFTRGALRLRLGLGLGLWCWALWCGAQTLKPVMTGAEAALYRGSDRYERLVEAAQKEGVVSVYHVYPSLPSVLSEFTKKYGIKVKVWRSGSETVLQRIVTEAKAGRFDVDIVQNNSPESEAAYREKLLQEVHSPYQSDLIAPALPVHHQWAGLTVDVWVASYNTNKYKKTDLPKTYADLQDPKWKGALGIEAFNQSWFGTLLAEMGEEQGLKIFNSIVATNGISARKGHSLLTMLVSSGEVPLALTTYSWIPEQLKLKGAPVDYFALQPLIAQTSAIAMLKKAPNPNAAVLLYDFLLSDGQKILADDHFIPTSKKIQNPFTGMTLKFVDPGEALDMQAKWQKNFEETITKRVK
jgi:iron(III) transport system substrate-binding protein